MSFSISYTYKIIDKFTPQLREIEKQTEIFNRKLQGLKELSQKSGASIEGMARQTKKAAVAFKQSTATMESSFIKVSRARLSASHADERAAAITAKANAQAAKAASQAESAALRLSSIKSKINAQETKAAASAARSVRLAAKKMPKGAGGPPSKRGGGLGVEQVAAGLGGGAVLTGALGAAMQLEDSVTELTKYLDFDTPEALLSFRKDMTKVGRVVGQSSAAMNLLAAESAKFGVAQADVGAFAKNVATAAVAFKIDLPDATETISKIKVKLDLTNKSLFETLDVINFIDDKGSASSKGMLEIMGRVSGIASSLGVAPDVLAGFAGTAELLGKGGPQSVATAAEGLEMMLQRLQDIKKFDPSIAAGLTKNFTGTIIGVLENLNKMPEVARNLAVQDLFGLEASPFVLNMINKLPLLQKNLALAADKTGAIGSMSREFNKVSQNTSEKLKKVKAGLVDISAEIGTAALPALKAFSDWFTETAPKVQEFIDKNPGIAKLALGFAGLLAAVIPIAIAVGTVAFAFTAAATAIASVVPMLLAIGTAIAIVLSPIGVYVLAIGMLTAGLVLLYQEGGYVTAFVDELVSSMKDLYAIAQSIGELGFWNTLKDVGLATLEGFGFQGMAEHSAIAAQNAKPVALNDMTKNALSGSVKPADLSVSKDSTTSVNLSGMIDFRAENAKIVKASLKSNVGGNLGANAASSVGKP